MCRNHKNHLPASLTVLLIVILMSACAGEPIPEATAINSTATVPTTAAITGTPPPPPMPTATPEKENPESASAVFTKTTSTLQPLIPLEPDDEHLSVNNSVVREKDGGIIVLIPEGEFMMGCDPNFNAGFDCNFDELPLHPVYLSAFFIDKQEVTNEQYLQCVEAGICKEPVYKNSRTRISYYGKPAYNKFPVIAVTWYEASDYCQWVNGSLPTEAQWEKAAKGTLPKAFPWGDQIPYCKLANSYNNALGEFCIGDTVKVGSYPMGASAYGVMDMAGNVWEWVNDWYSAEYYRHSPFVDPAGIDTGSGKVIRGGGYDYSWSKLRIAYKSNHHPNTRHLSYGFRCVNPIEDGVQ